MQGHALLPGSRLITTPFPTLVPAYTHRRYHRVRTLTHAPALVANATLQVQRLPSLHTLPTALPPSLRRLRLDTESSHAPQLPPLPETLVSLELRSTSTGDLPQLPDGLQVCHSLYSSLGFCVLSFRRITVEARRKFSPACTSDGWKWRKGNQT